MRVWAVALASVVLAVASVRALAFAGREAGGDEPVDCGDFMDEGPRPWRPESISQIVEGAELIVLGTVTRVNREGPANLPPDTGATPRPMAPGDPVDVTFYDFQVEEVLFGEPAASAGTSIVFREYGLHSVATLRTRGASMSEPGERRLLLLRRTEDGASWMFWRFQALRIQGDEARFADFECVSANELAGGGSLEAVLEEIARVAEAQRSGG